MYSLEVKVKLAYYEYVRCLQSQNVYKARKARSNERSEDSYIGLGDFLKLLHQFV